MRDEGDQAPGWDEQPIANNARVVVFRCSIMITLVCVCVQAVFNLEFIPLAVVICFTTYASSFFRDIAPLTNTLYNCRNTAKAIYDARIALVGCEIFMTFLMAISIVYDDHYEVYTAGIVSSVLRMIVMVEMVMEARKVSSTAVPGESQVVDTPQTTTMMDIINTHDVVAEASSNNSVVVAVLPPPSTRESS